MTPGAPAVTREGNTEDVAGQIPAWLELGLRVKATMPAYI